jgi:hypothetical protein
MASILVDEGYGNFELSHKVVRAVRGDMTKARNLLDKVIICQEQLNMHNE